MGSLPHLLTHGAPLRALRSRELRYYYLCNIYFYCKLFFTLGWYNVNCRYCFVVVIEKLAWHGDFLSLDLSRQQKRLQLPYSVLDAGTETSLCMKEVSFWAVASHESRKKQETIQQERKLKEWNISLQRQTDLKLKWWFIHYNRRYRSVYWLK